MKRWFWVLLWLPLLARAEEEGLWQQIGFTATEVLIYTDQLQKLDATECNQGPVSHHDSQATREQLLQRVSGEDRARLAALFDSPLVQSLLEENSQGIAGLLAGQQLTAKGPVEARRKLCLELALGFAENQRQAEAELDALLERYLNR